MIPFRVLYDITQLLESAEDSDARVTRVLEQLRMLVPYRRCAVLDFLPGQEPRLLCADELQPGEQAELMSRLLALHALLLAPQPESEQTASSPAHLAVPLIGLDEVLGVLYVERAEPFEDEGDVRSLTVIAAQLATYFSMLLALRREVERTRQVAEARKQAEAADRAKDEFLALVSHELRAPLNSILAWTDALRAKGTSPADRVRATDAIERSVRAQAKLIADLLDLSCVASATLRLDLRAVEPAKLIRSALQTLRAQVRQKSIRLEAALDESVTPLLADPRRLSQIVANLVANAIKFSPHGGQVEVRLERVGVLARIQVIDRGAGIHPEILSHIFEPFKQVDSSSTRQHGGLGIGLALVKDLVELHGGQVRAESAGEQQGATFTVELPLVGDAPAEAMKPVPSSAPLLGRALDGVHVMVVDDDRDVGEILQIVLEDQGAIVTVATSAAEALAALALSKPDVLLSDIGMPGASGFDLMRSLVAREGASAPPAAALSAYGLTQNLKDVLGAGFQMLLEKPVDLQALVTAVASLARVGGAKGAS